MTVAGFYLIFGYRVKTIDYICLTSELHELLNVVLNKDIALLIQKKVKDDEYMNWTGEKIHKNRNY